MRPISKLLLALLCLLLVRLCVGEDGDPTLRTRKATVKITTTYIRPNYYMPWRMKTHGAMTGSGSVIKDRLILTNAHVVSDATFIQVLKENDPTKYEAEVLFIGHECDLALLRVKDEKFFADTTALEIGDAVPKFKSEVATFGFPVGGEHISITEGVVSRVEVRSYTHSSKSAFITVQTDAAINPGNSGGPVIQNEKIVGVAFQARSGAENIGYMIPVPIIRHFLKDVSDGKFDGFPDLGIYTDDLENKSYREYLGMRDDQSGTLVIRVIPGGCSEGHLKEGDVIMKVDGAPIADDGSIAFEHGRIQFTYPVDLKQIGEDVELVVWRNKQELTVKYPVSLPPERIPWFDEYETLPRYYVYAGIIFEPLNRGYLETWKEWYYNADSRMLYYFTYLERDRCHPERKEFVVVNSVLPDSANTYVSDLSNKVLARVNGVKITCLEDVIEAFKHPQGRFHVILVEGGHKPIILNAERAAEANARILQKYKIPWDRRLNKHSGYGRK